MIFLAPLAIWLGTAACYLGLYKNSPFALRRSVLTASIGILFFIAVSTELLSAFNGIGYFAVASSWVTLNLVLGLVFWFIKNQTGVSIPELFTLWKAGTLHFFGKCGYTAVFLLASLLIITCIVALVAAPNNADALSYHISRPGYWIRNGNVGHYASHIERAISFSPFSEYIHLHTLLLSGGNRYFQIVQWLSLCGILGYVSMLTEMLGGARKAVPIALVFAATLPIVVLESMTTQNDLVVAFFILAAAFYIFDFIKTKNQSARLLLLLAVALGMMTKGTFVFYTLPFGLYLFVFMISRAERWKQLVVLTVGVVTLTLLLNAPFWYRTYQIFGSPIGTLSGGNRNELSFSNFLSSASKHVFLHLGFVSPGNAYNAFLENGLNRFHETLGTPLDDPATGMKFKMNKLNFNEDFAHNLIGMLLILISIPSIFVVKISPAGRLYAFLTFSGLLVFCFFISYQVYGSRLHIPFFLLAAPVIGLVFGEAFYKRKSSILQILLWLGALPFALLSITHPLLSTKWFFEQIFPRINATLHLNINTDNQLNLKQESILYSEPEKVIWGDHWAEIRKLRDYVDSLDAGRIGFDFEEGSFDYGYQYILEKPGRDFQHVMVRNRSVMLEKSDFSPDCIIAEHDEGTHFLYHGKTYRKSWAGSGRWVYIPPRQPRQR